MASYAVRDTVLDLLEEDAAAWEDVIGPADASGTGDGEGNGFL